MSYSFNFTVATRAEARQRTTDELNAVVALQPEHAKDFEPALINAFEAIDVLDNDPSRDIHVECYGSLQWHGSPAQFCGVTIHAGAWHVPKAG